MNFARQKKSFYWIYVIFIPTALMDTIQIVQSLRNCIPAPAIPLNTWKNDDRGGKKKLRIF